MQKQENSKFYFWKAYFGILMIFFVINPVIALIFLFISIYIIKKIKTDQNFFSSSKDSQENPIITILQLVVTKLTQDFNKASQATSNNNITPPLTSPIFISTAYKLKKNQKYLQIALNGDINEAKEIIRLLPKSEKIIIEAGTPLIKIYGISVVSKIKSLSPDSYIVADIKTADMANEEVTMCALAGANAVTCLGIAPIETIDRFIQSCEDNNIEAMVDMMNVPSAITILKKLKKQPQVVILHRGVDETEKTSDKQIPFYQIKQIKGNSKSLVSVAGGDTAREIQSAIFNDADIVVVWKNFMQVSGEINLIANDFLKEIK